ncbi:MAG: tetratricopeptide repeat protein, partial [Candidatus Obscuribacterales bacterium]|nr:tetratricopeptide repeat protein [Candidatus Obscuribacterales bacterium]
MASGSSTSPVGEQESILKEINECGDEKQKLLLLTKLAGLKASRTDSSQEKITDQILQLSKKLYGSKSHEYADALNWQGQLLFKKKNFKQSADSYHEAAAIFELAGDEYGSKLMSSVSGEIAGSCASGLCSDNSALYEKLLELKRKFIGNNKQPTMIAAMLLAEIYSKQHKYDKALPLFK